MNKTILKFSYLRKITNIAIDINLELDAVENMFVRLACRLGLADTFWFRRQLSFQNFRLCVNVIKNIASL